MNGSIHQIREGLSKLPIGTKIYIKQTKGDRISIDIMERIFATPMNPDGERGEGYLVLERPRPGEDTNIIVVEAPIFTPSSFDMCATKFLQDVQEKVESQAGNQSA